MKITFDLKFLIAAIASFTVSYMTITGAIDQYISFAGEGNAFGFCVMAFFLGLMCLVSSISRPETTKS